MGLIPLYRDRSASYRLTLTREAWAPTAVWCSPAPLSSLDALSAWVRLRIDADRAASYLLIKEWWRVVLRSQSTRRRAAPVARRPPRTPPDAGRALLSSRCVAGLAARRFTVESGGALRFPNRVRARGGCPFRVR
jgi:hypothetical protein